MSSCVDAAALAPLSAPEAFAASVFRQHLPAVLQALPPGAEPDPRHSGAEWWVQVKPIAAEASNAEAAVDLHYDKDEELSAAFLLGSFPDLSTVTCVQRPSEASERGEELAGSGAPTTGANNRRSCGAATPT
jgi:hypothetical protein